ncbi:MAG: cysteine hydrolase [Prolixibacteraceae bacterium]|nr:cysteine hydrolase [Prolixibacteraceae bacterium]
MNRLLLAAIILIFSINLKAQDIDSTALIIIDIQEFYFPGGAVPLEKPELAAQNAAKVLDYFRKNNGLVAHVRHNYEPGGLIHKLVKPLDNEKIFSKDDVNAFLNTGLQEYLQVNNIKNVVLCGMQTHMCLEAATRAAHDFGYNCTVIDDACTTRDLKYGDRTVIAADVHASTLATIKSYATIEKTDEFLKKKKLHPN